MNEVLVATSFNEKYMLASRFPIDIIILSIDKPFVGRCGCERQWGTGLI